MVIRIATVIRIVMVIRVIVQGDGVINQVEDWGIIDMRKVTILG
jgi:hypothetical protein